MSTPGLGASIELPSSTQAKRKVSSTVMLVLKIAISVGLLATVIFTEDPVEVWARVKEANLALVAGAIALLLLQYPIAAVRWRLVLQSLQQDAPTVELMRLVWVGQFISQVLPTFVAGDSVRVWFCRNNGMPLREAFSSIVWDRLLGFTGLALLSLMMAPRLFDVAPDSAAAPAVTILASLAILGTFSLMLAGKFISFLPERINAARPLAPLKDGWILMRHSQNLAAVILLATVTNVLASISAWLLAQSLGIDLKVLDALAFVPAALFTSLLPISIAGWGVREATLGYLLPLVGIASTDAVTLSLMLGAALMIASLPGLQIFYRTNAGSGQVIPVEIPNTPRASTRLDKHVSEEA